jgi:predicted DNA-binding transcriptional regulator YafY
MRLRPIKEHPVARGDILYGVRASYPKEVAWWAMSWGSEAEVLEPPELREYVANEVRKMAGLYRK